MEHWSPIFLRLRPNSRCLRLMGCRYWGMTSREIRALLTAEVDQNGRPGSITVTPINSNENEYQSVFSIRLFDVHHGNYLVNTTARTSVVQHFSSIEAF